MLLLLLLLLSVCRGLQGALLSLLGGVGLGSARWSVALAGAGGSWRGRRGVRDRLTMLALVASAVALASPPAVHRHAAFAVKEQLGIPYAQGVVCNAKPCVPCHGGLKTLGPPKCDEACLNPLPGSVGPPSAGCPHPQVVNLTLDLYTPQGAGSLGKRPALVAIHSGGYAVNGERGFAPSYEMTAACKHFAARGYVAITMVYRLTNAQTGGALAPANWSVPSPLPNTWEGGFKPAPQAIWPAIRDSKAAIRWLRGQAQRLSIEPDFLVPTPSNISLGPVTFPIKRLI